MGTMTLILRGNAAGDAIAGNRSWDTDITGLTAAMLTKSSLGGAPVPVGSLPQAVVGSLPQSMPASPFAAAPVGAPAAGVEVVYGLPAEGAK